MHITDKLNAFSQFIGLLSGTLDVTVSTKENPVQGSLVLPDISGMDDTALDVLYGLCLREAGNLVKSKKSVHDIKNLKTLREVQGAYWVDQARVERYLARKFGGGGDMLFEHFSKHAKNPRFTSTVLGVNPAQATPDQVMLLALKWHLLGRPKFHWDALFDQGDWSRACDFMTPHETLWRAPLRSFADCSGLAKEMLRLWHKTEKTKDESTPRVETAQEKALSKIQDMMDTKVASFAEKAQKKIDALKKKASDARAEYAKKRAELGPVLDPLRATLSDLTEEKKKWAAVEQQMKDLDKLDRQIERLEPKLDRLTDKKEKLSEKVSAPDKGEDARAKKDQEFQEKMEKISKDLEEKIASVQKLQDTLNEKMDELKSSHDSATDNKKEQLEKRMERIQEKLDALDHRKDDMKSSAEQKENALSEKMEAFEKRQEEKEASRAGRQESLSEKMKEIEQKLGDISKEQQALEASKQAAEQSARDALKKAGLAATPEAVEKALDTLGELRAEHHKAQAEWDKAAKPLADLRATMSEASGSASKEAKSANWEMEKMMRSVEEKLVEAGLDVSLTEKMEEMEGWDEANTAQDAWDEKASNETMQSVINGCGGGRGTRDLMLAIEETQGLIDDIDPAQIFADVAHISPLSGFAEAGNGGTETPTEKSETDTAFTKERHTVWSKRFDKIVNAPKKSSALISRLRRENAGDIKRTQTLFRKHLKPSFKPKFVGGREEGDLDARNLWKLAATQDSDFYEVTSKRPDTKSAATIMVDMSGSIASGGENVAERLQKMVMLLSEGLTSSHIPHEILGYSAPIEPLLAEMSIPETFNRKSCRLETVVLKSFKDRDLSGLESLVVSQADNSDGESVRIGVSRLLKQQGKNKIMFLISDGKPYMQDADTLVLDADLSLALFEASQKKVAVYGLGLSDSHPVMGSSYVAMEDDDIKTIEKMLTGGVA